MCERAFDLRLAVEKYASAFDAALLAPAAASHVVADMTAIANMATTLVALAAARVAESELWTRTGAKSPAHALARKTGTSVGAATDTLNTGRRLREQPALAASARKGLLSAAQTNAIADAVAANPGAEESLVNFAGRASLRELRHECAKAKVEGIDPEERRRRIHDKRSVRTYTDAEGVGHLHWRDNPERIAEVIGALTPGRDRIFKAARRARCYESPDAYTADALVALVRDLAGSAQAAGKRRRSTNAKIIVRVDLDTLLRGYPVAGEVCEIVGFGPIAVSAVHDMIATGDPFLAALATSGERILGVAHLGRKATAKQQTALEWLHPACTVEGCPSQAFLQTDHRIDWAKVHITMFDNLDRPCAYHHFLKTARNWAFVEGSGKRPFVPPTDPRHPNFRPDPEGGPAP